MVKAIFFDVDGTLISFETHEMPKTTQRALQLLRDKGIKLFVATGRHRNEYKFLDDYFLFDGYISLNGGFCYSGDEVIDSHTIDKSDVEKLAKRLEEEQVASKFLLRDKMIMNRLDDAVTELDEMLNLETAPVMDVSVALENDVYMMVVYLSKEREYIVTEIVPHLVATRWYDTFFDLIPQGISKAVGIDKMLAHFDIPLEKTMAFGDGGNDVPMLQHVPLGVAMGNAGEAAKSVAAYVTASVDDDGIWKALEHYGIL